MIKTCKSCNSELTGNFCSMCGKPSTLKRINASYIRNEIGNILNLDKGIFYTIKVLFIQPGKSIREFLAVDRNRLIKPITFVILTSFFYSIINQFFKIEDQYIQYNELDKNPAITLLKWIQENYGYANILMGVFIAFSVKLFFRKSKYNFYEILVLLCFIIGMGMLIFSVFIFLEGIFHVKLYLYGNLLAIGYTTFAIADFFDRRVIKNYIKSFFAYIIGMFLFFIILVFLGLIFFF